MKFFQSKFILLSVLLVLINIQYSHAQSDDNEYNVTAMSHFINGLFLNESGDTENAIFEFEKAVRFDSSQITFYNLLIECYIKSNNLNKLVPTLEKSLALNGKNERNASILLEIYTRYLRDLKKAERHLRLMVENFPGSSRYKVQYINVLFKNKKEREAKEAAAEYLNEDILDRESLKTLSGIFIANNIDDGIKLYEKGLKINSDNPYYYYNLGFLYEQKGKIDNALDYYLKAYDLKPVDDDIIEQLVKIYMDRENFDKVLSLLLNYKKEDLSDLKIQVANQFIQNGKDQLADSLLYAEVKRGAANKDMNMLLGIAYFNLSEYDKSISFISTAIKEDSTNYYPFFILGMTFNQKNEYNKAIYCLKKAVSLNPEDINSLSLIGDIYYSIKEYGNAREYYEKVLEINPDFHLTLNNYSYMLAETDRDLPFALEMSKKAVEMNPENNSYLDTIGWIYFKLKNFPKALEYITKASEITGASATVFEHLGDIYKELGDFEKAKKFWKISFDKDNSNLKLLEKIDQH